MAFTFNQDKAAQIFFRAFKACANDIIKGLPQDEDSSDSTIANQVHTVATQLNNDFARLECVIEVILFRVLKDPEWAATAVKVYELLAYAIDPEFPHPDGQKQGIKGAFLVRDQMMRACQSQFQKMIKGSHWNCGLINFLRGLCTFDSITSATPGIILDVLDRMVQSLNLIFNDNFDLLIRLIMGAGLFVDSQAGYEQRFTAWFRKLQERSRLCMISDQLAVYGVLRLRESGWQVVEELGRDAEDQ